jgi:hypothetical protein
MERFFVKTMIRTDPCHILYWMLNILTRTCLEIKSIVKYMEEPDSSKEDLQTYQITWCHSLHYTSSLAMCFVFFTHFVLAYNTNSDSNWKFDIFTANASSVQVSQSLRACVPKNYQLRVETCVGLDPEDLKSYTYVAWIPALWFGSWIHRAR